MINIVRENHDTALLLTDVRDLSLKIIIIHNSMHNRVSATSHVVSRNPQNQITENGSQLMRIYTLLTACCCYNSQRLTDAPTTTDVNELSLKIFTILCNTRVSAIRYH